MRFFALALIAAGPFVVFAKDCAVFYSWSNDTTLNPARDQKATLMCNDVGGSVSPLEVAIANQGSCINKCAVCRNARGSTTDYDRTIYQNGSPLQFSVRCGYFGQSSCQA